MDPTEPTLNRRHHQRLREIYRSAGWPCQDSLEVELIAAGQVERLRSAEGHETLRLTDAGIQTLAQAFARNQAARSPHEALVEQVAVAMTRAGRLAWRGLALRVPLPRSLLQGLPADVAMAAEPPIASMQLRAFDDETEALQALPDHAWCMACPDVFSIRRSSVEVYLEPVVHEIKVSRADLLGDLKKPAKRAAYLGMAGACWYVLGLDAKGRPVGGPDDVPPECGVMVAREGRLEVLREAPRRAMPRLPLHVWMSLAQATPVVAAHALQQEHLAPSAGNP
ncbi:hypothetical protein J2W49_003419 [Hydrogenophaga palleronii]|uniref:Restriction endonuclease n=1 Tax=Hydrogenophaga palleronii TaxID=65655 RepID=A0ABU1WQ67_9BURK|nr:hypothetical protein [Hydrogenophaga palleronii]MDR7151443.1 hypothetical protein [Hydrogenophaga palleronii]